MKATDALALVILGWLVIGIAFGLGYGALQALGVL